MTRPFQHFLSAMKERTIQLTKRLNTDAAQHDTHGKQQTRLPLTPRYFSAAKLQGAPWNTEYIQQDTQCC